MRPLASIATAKAVPPCVKAVCLPSPLKNLSSLPGAAVAVVGSSATTVATHAANTLARDAPLMLLS
jgi:hypothetical protein